MLLTSSPYLQYGVSDKLLFKDWLVLLAYGPVNVIVCIGYVRFTHSWRFGIIYIWNSLKEHLNTGVLYSVSTKKTFIINFNLDTWSCTCTGSAFNVNFVSPLGQIPIGCLIPLSWWLWIFYDLVLHFFWFYYPSLHVFLTPFSMSHCKLTWRWIFDSIKSMSHSTKILDAFSHVNNFSQCNQGDKI